LHPAIAVLKIWRIRTVVVAKLKFRNIERHVFSADLVDAADDAAFDAPGEGSSPVSEWSDALYDVWGTDDLD
jgi:hypothetical protein